MKVLVLGCGLVGKTITEDLAKRHDVTVGDITHDAFSDLDPSIKTMIFNVNIPSMFQKVKAFDLVVCAVPGYLGFETLKSIIKEGVNVVDISFFPEDALSLHELAVENGVTAVVDMGVAPGLDNLILGHFNSLMDVKYFECLVGGLPKELNTYKAPFSPADVVQEYLRPARLFENGKVVTKEALSEPESISAPGTELEAFNTDGLRSLLKTMKHIPNMKEKTLRYHGHREGIEFLRDNGFFEEDRMDSTCETLFKSWKLTPQDDEFTYMRVTVKGDEKSGWLTSNHVWELYDETDPKTRTSSMARTTGYTCCAMVESLLKNQWSKPGIFPGELIGHDEVVFNHVISFLSDRGVTIIKNNIQ
tara:strand:+ start:644 stop:1726 length:1083 start_codon:yes stop_codon:yes gene_type:complete